MNFQFKAFNLGNLVITKKAEIEGMKIVFTGEEIYDLFIRALKEGKIKFENLKRGLEEELLNEFFNIWEKEGLSFPHDTLEPKIEGAIKKVLQKAREELKKKVFKTPFEEVERGFVKYDGETEVVKWSDIEEILGR